MFYLFICLPLLKSIGSHTLISLITVYNIFLKPFCPKFTATIFKQPPKVKTIRNSPKRSIQNMPSKKPEINLVLGFRLTFLRTIYFECFNLEEFLCFNFYYPFFLNF